MKDIKMSLETARRLYSASDRVTRDWILENFTEDELRVLPESLDDLGSVDGYYFDGGVDIIGLLAKPVSTYATQRQANAERCIKAITHLLKAYNGDWTPDWEDDDGEHGYIIRVFVCTLNITKGYREPQLLTFETREKAEHFLKHHSDLIKQAAPILWGVVL